jgi:hypothetical protein
VNEPSRADRAGSNLQDQQAVAAMHRDVEAAGADLDRQDRRLTGLGAGQLLHQRHLLGAEDPADRRAEQLAHRE